MSKVLEEIYKEGMIEGEEKGKNQANEDAVKKLMVSLGLKEEEARKIIYS